MKKIAIACVVLVFALSCMSSSASEQKGYSIGCTGNQVLAISYDDHTINIVQQKSSEGSEEPQGPESFYVASDNAFYILDSRNYQILCYEGNEITAIIRYKGVVDKYFIDIGVDDSDIYILSQDNYVYKLEMSGKCTDKWDLNYLAYIGKSDNLHAPVKINLREVFIENHQLGVILDDGSMHNISNASDAVCSRNIGINDNMFSTIDRNGNSIKIPSYSTPIAAYNIMNTTKGNAFYTSELYIRGNNTVNDRRVYFESNGRIVGYCQLEQPQLTLPHVQFRVMKNGDVYQMILSDTQLSINKLTYRNDYNVVPEYIDTSSAESSSEIMQTSQYVANPTTAQGRCYNITGYSWTYVPSTHGNKTVNQIPSNVVAPTYLAQFTTPTPAPYSTSGIPYSWAGGRGLDVAYGQSNTFIYGVTNGKYMGNISENTCANAYGLDCSGLVDVVFLLGYKFNTNTLVPQGAGTPTPSPPPFYLRNSSPYYPLHMDILDRQNDHVFIFDYSTTWQGGTLWGIWESTTTYNYRGGNGAHIDKSVYSIFYIDDANLNGYHDYRLVGW